MTAQEQLGSVYDPLGEHLQDPYPFFARAREEEPVFYAPTYDVWVVTRYEDVREVLRRPDLYSSRNALPQVYELTPAALAEMAKGYPPVGAVVATDGDAHRRTRSAVAPEFTVERIRGLEPFIRAEATRLLDAVAGDGRADLMARFAAPLPLAVTCHQLGLGPEHHETVDAGFQGLLELFGMPKSETEQADAARRIVAAQHLAGEHARARRAEPRDDLTSRLIAALAPGEEPLTFEEETHVVAILVEFMLAGQINTGPLIGSTVRYLLEQPGRWELVCRQPELIPQVLEETLRFDSPSSGLYRETTEEVTLGGVQLPKGAKIGLKFHSANRGNPAVTDRPDEYDPTRKPTKHLSFGFGVHHCVGAPLARTVGRVSLELLTRRLPGLRLDPTRPVSMQAVHDRRNPEALHVTW